MNKRLQTILEIEQISPSQLADALGVQRGGISHILSGRNKPSFDFLEKILHKYPNINAEWLITGQGKPLKADYGAATTLFSSNNSVKTIQQPNIQNNIFDDNIVDDTSLHNSAYDENANVNPDDVAGPAGAKHSHSPSQSKKPVRIIVYFSDGTYTEFYPFSVPSPLE